MGLSAECSVLSESRTAGRVSPRLRRRDVVSTSCGMNLRGLGEGSIGGGRVGVEGEVRDEVAVSLCFLLDLAEDSTGWGRMRLGRSGRSVGECSWPCNCGGRLLRAVVSTGSGANRRITLLVFSTG